MGVYEGRGQLSRAIKDLMARWTEVKSSWDDSNSERFEEKYLDPLEHHLQAAVSAMDSMGVLISQAHHDCDE
jgi:hypothetical protein